MIVLALGLVLALSLPSSIACLPAVHSRRKRRHATIGSPYAAAPAHLQPERVATVRRWALHFSRMVGGLGGTVVDMRPRRGGSSGSQARSSGRRDHWLHDCSLDEVSRSGLLDPVPIERETREPLLVVLEIGEGACRGRSPRVHRTLVVSHIEADDIDGQPRAGARWEQIKPSASWTCYEDRRRRRRPAIVVPWSGAVGATADRLLALSSCRVDEQTIWAGPSQHSRRHQEGYSG